jgi:hypothetical protein
MRSGRIQHRDGSVHKLTNKLHAHVTLMEAPMKRVFITLTTTIALTHAAHASGWMWFHGDIGLSSPFVSSSLPANNATTGAVPERKVVTKQKAASKTSVAGHTFKSTRHSITSR